MPKFINIADLIDPDDPQKRTYREINAIKNHSIQVGTMVEVKNRNYDNYPYKNYPRAFVVHQGRDCDQTPLYSLSLDPLDTQPKNQTLNHMTWDSGYSEENLIVVSDVNPYPETNKNYKISVGALVEIKSFDNARAFIIWHEKTRYGNFFYLALDYKNTTRHYSEWYNVGWNGPFSADSFAVIEPAPKR